MDLIYYIFLFVSLYFQVFFLISYLGDFDFYNPKDTDRADLPPLVDKEDLPKISIIVACWNEALTIDQTVDSIFLSDYPRSHIELLLVNDGSTDDTWQRMQTYKNTEGIILLNKENGGKFTAINMALQEASGDLIATVDADTHLEPTAVSFMVSRFIGDPELDALGATIVLHAPKSLTQLAQSIEYQLFAFTKLILAKMHGALVVPGAFSVYRRRVFDELGLFKEAHKLEDLELTFRMQESGMKVGQSRDALAYTHAPRTVHELFKQRLRWGYGFIKNMYDYRHLIYNKRQGDFGAFTLPMSVFSYVAIVVIFVLSWFSVVQSLVRSALKISLIGWGSLFSFDFFNINLLSVHASLFITIVLYAIVIFMIFSGKKLVGDTSKNPFSFLIFFILYSVIVPFWVLKSIYNVVFEKNVRWR